MAIDGFETTYACRCLNVRLRRQATEGHPPPDLASSDPDPILLYVGDEGIIVMHPQLTLRTVIPRSSPGGSNVYRHITLTCLICHILVYQAHHIVSPHVEAVEGPIFPTDEWAEQDTLKSSTGWIAIRKDCLTKEAILQAEKSPGFSPLFSIILPDQHPSAAEHFESELNRQASNLAPQGEYPPPNGPYVAHLPPLLPPAPFIPSHPVFVHLSAVALSKSQDLRAAAERHISEIVRQKLSEIEQTEAELRRDVEILWKEFRRGVESIEDKKSSSKTSTRVKGNETWSVQHSSPPGRGTPVSVHNFVPEPNPVKRGSSTSIPRVSSLSASLTTSFFPHPEEQPSKSPRTLAENELLRSPVSSNQPASPTLAPSRSLSPLTRHPSEPRQLASDMESTAILEPFHRNMDPAIDVAASFRYFTNLESENQRSPENQIRDQSQSKVDILDNLHPASVEVESSDNGFKGDSEVEGHGLKSSRPAKTLSVSTNVDETNGLKEDDEHTSNQNGGKGKRKVTFDVKPAVVTITRERNVEKGDAQREAQDGQDSSEMIFDLDEDGSERSGPDAVPKPVLQLLEHPSVQPREARSRGSRGSDSAGLPGSFAALRPASLPTPMTTNGDITSRSERDNTESEPPQQQAVNDSKSDDRRRHSRPEIPQVQETEVRDPREAEILRLLAADTPSHRGLWKRDSKAWQMFVRRQDSKDFRRWSAHLIPEETESEDNFDVDTYATRHDDGFSEEDATGDRWPRRHYSALARSLPIEIGPLRGIGQELSLASYQTQSSLTDRPGTYTPHLTDAKKVLEGGLPSSVVLRKASYAMRDRNRSMDPGPLDFADEDDDTAPSDTEEAGLDGPGSGERARRRALRILQKRSEIPAAGMWRSLAQ